MGGHGQVELDVMFFGLERRIFKMSFLVGRTMAMMCSLLGKIRARLGRWSSWVRQSEAAVVCSVKQFVAVMVGSVRQFEGTVVCSVKQFVAEVASRVELFVVAVVLSVRQFGAVVELAAAMLLEAPTGAIQLHLLPPGQANPTKGPHLFPHWY